MGQDCIRILPLLKQKETIEIRDRHKAKLTNLPYGCTAYELSDYMETINAKSCFIPRSPVRYQRQRYAWVTFASETDMVTAMETHVSLRQANLNWESPSSLICNMCFKRGHRAIECRSKTRRAVQYKQLNKLYENRGIAYRKPLIKSPTLTRSFRDAVLGNSLRQTASKDIEANGASSSKISNSRPWNRVNLNNPSQPQDTSQPTNRKDDAVRDLHSTAQRTLVHPQIVAQLRQEVDEINNKFKEFHKRLESVETKLNQILSILTKQQSPLTNNAENTPPTKTQKHSTSPLKSPDQISEQNYNSIIVQKDKQIAELVEFNRHLEAKQQEIMDKITNIEHHVWE